MSEDAEQGLLWPEALSCKIAVECVRTGDDGHRWRKLGGGGLGG